MPVTITKDTLLDLFKELEDAKSDLKAAKSTNAFLLTAEDRLDLDLNIESLITRVDIAKSEYFKAKADYLASQRTTFTVVVGDRDEQ